MAHIVLNRPQARNAITVALATGLADALRAAAGRARVIVIRGAGGHFCAGGDFGEVSRLRAGGPDALRPLFETFGAACELIGELPVPVVAAVEGYAMAGGFELVQACDIAIARDDAVLADNHLNFGMIPGGGGSQRLPRLAGAAARARPDPDRRPAHRRGGAAVGARLPGRARGRVRVRRRRAGREPGGQGPGGPGPGQAAGHGTGCGGRCGTGSRWRPRPSSSTSAARAPPRASAGSPAGTEGMSQ